jgi:hypothetical protein
MPPCGYGRASAQHYGNGVAVGFLRLCLSGCGQARIKVARDIWRRPRTLAAVLVGAMPQPCSLRFARRPYPKGHAAAPTQMFAMRSSCSLCARAIRPSKPGDDRTGAIGRRSNGGVLGRAKLRADAFRQSVVQRRSKTGTAAANAAAIDGRCGGQI